MTSCDALESALEAGGVIQISGTISDCGVLDVESDTSKSLFSNYNEEKAKQMAPAIIGTGSDSTITGGGLRIKDADNVIVRNIVFHTPSESDDLLALDGATNVWIGASFTCCAWCSTLIVLDADHNSFSSEGLVGSKDTYDGSVFIQTY